MASAAAAIGSAAAISHPSGPASQSRGPQAGHALGCAWKRRSDGDAYSAWHAGHITNGAIVVFGRSYGMSIAMVKRGPQFVQLVKGYPKRRSAGSRISRRQSGQVARSAGIDTRRSDEGDDATISKAAAARPSIGIIWSSAICAAGGGVSCRAATKASSAGTGPNASMVTPLASLRTQPPSPCTSSQAEHPRPEADALYDAADFDSPPAGRTGRWNGRHLRRLYPGWRTGVQLSSRAERLPLIAHPVMMAAMGKRIVGVLVVAAAVGAALLPVPAAWVERYYARGWFPPLQRVLTAASNTVPFAVLDALLLAGVGAAAVALVSALRAPRGHRIAAAGRLAWQAAVIASLTYLVFVATWGANYRREPLTALVDFDQRRVTTPAVMALNETALGELARLRPKLPAGHVGWPDVFRVAADLQPAFETGTRLLSLPEPVRAGRPKASLLDFYFTRAGVSGMTDPFFLETILSSNLLPFEFPAVIAHEWGHLAGLARESDASFFGLLVCLHGNDAARYSAWLDIFVRTLGARDREDRRAAIARLPEAVRADLQAMAARSARDEVRVVSLMAWRTYDTYLQSQRVESGVRNYGEVVRLLAGTRFEAGWRPVLRWGAK